MPASSSRSGSPPSGSPFLQTADTAPLRITPEPFETALLGGPVWKAVVETPEILTREAVAAVVAAGRQAGVRLISCRLPADGAWSAKMEEAGFRPVETLLTLERDFIHPWTLPVPEAEPALTSDEAACADIGRHAFLFDRFHRDRRNLDDEDGRVADGIKEAWVRNAFAGRADVILVVRRAEGPDGFVLCLKRGATAIIDLIAVSPLRQGRGVGRSLVAGVLTHYAQATDRVRVGTQDDNAASIRLYKSFGFMEVSRHTTFHWTPAPGTPRSVSGSCDQGATPRNSAAR